MDIPEQNLLKSRLVTNRDRTMLGFISPRPREIYAIMYGLKNVDGQRNLFSTPITVRGMQDVEDPSDLLKVQENSYACVERTKVELVKQEDILSTSKITLEDISKKKVHKSDKTIDQIMAKTREYEERLKYDRESTRIEDNKVRLPECCCPYFYNTEDDLNKFEIGDVVEIRFGGGSRTADKFKNKTVTFVVNNFKSYEWCRPTRRLALIPLRDGWTLKDIVILDDSDRFEALMEDLFPCNRIPYRGWRSKEVTIKKIGKQVEIPTTGHKPKPTLKMLWDQQDDEYVLLKTSREINWGIEYEPRVIRVGKRKDIHSQNITYKIYTTEDRKEAVKWVQEFIERTKKEIEKLKESIKNSLEFAAGIKFIEELNYFEHKIKG